MVKKVIPSLFSHAMGELIEDDGKVSFTYYDSFLKTKLNPSPLVVPFNNKTYDECPRIFYDSIPNNWCVNKAQVYFDTLGIKVPTVIDRISEYHSAEIGAIEFNCKKKSLTCREEFSFTDIIKGLIPIKSDTNKRLTLFMFSAIGSVSLCYWDEVSESVLIGDEVVCKHMGKQYILESNPNNNQDIKKRAALISLAGKCGINVPTFTVKEEKYGTILLTKRWDMIKSNKLHFTTLASLIAEENHSILTRYEDYMQVAIKLVGGNGVKIDAFTRIVFNVLLSCHNDYPYSVGFLMNKKGEWSLSPQYSQAYTEIDDIHKMSVNEKKIDIEVKDLIEFAGKFNIDEEKVIEICSMVASKALGIDEIVFNAGIKNLEMTDFKKRLFSNPIFKKGKIRSTYSKKYGSTFKIDHTDIK